MLEFENADITIAGCHVSFSTFTGTVLGSYCPKTGEENIKSGVVCIIDHHGHQKECAQPDFFPEIGTNLSLIYAHTNNQNEETLVGIVELASQDVSVFPLPLLETSSQRSPTLEIGVGATTGLVAGYYLAMTFLNHIVAGIGGVIAAVSAQQLASWVNKRQLESLKADFNAHVMNLGKAVIKKLESAGLTESVKKGDND